MEQWSYSSSTRAFKWTTVPLFDHTPTMSHYKAQQGNLFIFQSMSDSTTIGSEIPLLASKCCIFGWLMSHTKQLKNHLGSCKLVACQAVNNSGTTLHLICAVYFLYKRDAGHLSLLWLSKDRRHRHIFSLEKHVQHVQSA